MAESVPLARIVHAIPNRTRFRIASRRGDAVFFASIATALSAMAGIQRVTVQSVTGSILLEHSKRLPKLLEAVEEARLFRVSESWQPSERSPPVVFDPKILIGASMGGLTGILAAFRAGPSKVSKLVLVDVVPRYEKDGSARIRDFMFSNVDGFATLEEAADAVAAYLPHRKRPSSPEGLKKNLRLRDGRWHWHWDPAFLTKPNDDPFLRVEQLEQAAIDLQIPILLIRGRLSDVVSPDGVKDFLAKVPHAEFVELSEAGHTAAGDDTDAFSEAVVAFVNR